MSLEQSIDGLALAINALAQALSREPQQAAEEPKTRKPRATKTEVVEASAEPVAAEAPAPAYTLDDVRNVLTELRDKDGSRDRCFAILKTHTGQERLPGCPESAFAAIIDDARALLA